MLIIKNLQLAIDLTDLKSSLKLLQKVGEYIDIIELGTPLLVAEGISIIPIFKELYPDKIIFADLKIMDGGEIISELAFKEGADMISVLAAANDETIKAAVKKAEDYNGLVMVDLCAVKNIRERAQEIELLKADYISVHRAIDRESEGKDPLKELELIKNIKIKKAVAGGINLNNFEDAAKSFTDTIIVGGAIYRSTNPRSTAEKMQKILKK